MTLVTVGGLARRARRRARATAIGPPLHLAILPRPIVAPAFTLDEYRFLSEASALLAGSLDVDETVDRVASLGASFLADWCVVYLVARDGDAATGRVKAAHAEPRRAALAARFEDAAADRRFPPVVRRAIRTRQPALIPRVPADQLIAAAETPEQLEVMKQLEVESLMVMPLEARERCFGALALVSSSPRRPYTDASVPVARELARRAAVALANADRYREAQAAIEARDEILAVVAHDLRSPLHVIEFAAERLRREAPGPRRRTSDRSLDWIVNAAQRATSLVRDLLDRARLEWQTTTLDIVDVDPADIVREIERRAEPLGALASVRVRVDLARRLRPVRADRDRLIQALDNLVNNAIKFTPAEGTVTIGADSQHEGVRFFVADTGPGIEPDDLERIFDRFWQARGAEARGTGLGLSICKRIVEAHGGRLWVDSRVGVGTTVSFTIPTLSFLTP